MLSIAGRRVYVAGHQGMVGSALVRAIEPLGVELVTRTSADLDLRDQAATEAFFQRERPEVILFAAARVGGIQANLAAPAEFLYENVSMAAHAVHAAFRAGCRRFVYLGSTCVYPRLAPQPMPESALLSGEMEPTNEAYALSKIAGIKLCQFYRRQYGVAYHSILPTNLYGPGDNYHAEHAHVVPALVRRFHEARAQGHTTVEIWGTGRARRELMHVDDLAAAVLHVASLDDPPDWVNAGTGDEVTILELAELVAAIVGFTGRIVPTPERPDGPQQKLADCSLLRSTGWRPRIALGEGLAQTYQDLLQKRMAGALRIR